MKDEEIKYQEIKDEAYKFGIGRTPLVCISKERGVSVYAKLEYLNKFKSVKDRAAFFMINDVLKRGIIKKGMTIVEASSGNTGIAIANISKLLGIRAEIILPSGSSSETKEAVKSSGQILIEMPGDSTPGSKISIDPAIELARDKAGKHPDKYLNLDQYSNPNNTLAHYYTTGPEIVSSLGGYPTHVVVGIGTGGTLTGLAKYFKQFSPSTRIIAVEPEKDHHIQGLKNLTVSKVPALIEMNRSLVDEWISVTDEMAISETKYLLKKGLFVGLSSGANSAAARSVARNMDKGAIVTVFPDSAEKYRSVYIHSGMFTEKEFDENVHLFRK